MNITLLKKIYILLKMLIVNNSPEKLIFKTEKMMKLQ